jgi:hypothetical protein
MDNKELLNRLNGLFNTVSELRIEVAKTMAVEELDKLLDDLEANSKGYEIWIGYYDMDGFDMDYVLNNDSINAMMDINGETLVNYLLDYYKNNNNSINPYIYAPSSPTVAIKIRLEGDDLYNDNIDTYYIEYDGYDLDFDLG